MGEGTMKTLMNIIVSMIVIFVSPNDHLVKALS